VAQEGAWAKNPSVDAMAVVGEEVLTCVLHPVAQILSGASQLMGRPRTGVRLSVHRFAVNAERVSCRHRHGVPNDVDAF
jgi:hypothetical protein